MWQNANRSDRFIAIGGLHYNIGNLTIHGKPPYEGEVVGLDDRHIAFQHPRYAIRAYVDRGLDYFFGNPDPRYAVPYPDELKKAGRKVESMRDFIITWAPAKENAQVWPTYIARMTRDMKKSFGSEWPDIDAKKKVPLRHLLSGKFWDTWATSMAPNEMAAGWTDFYKKEMKVDYAKEADIAIRKRLQSDPNLRKNVEEAMRSDRQLKQDLIARGIYHQNGNLIRLADNMGENPTGPHPAPTAKQNPRP